MTNKEHIDKIRADLEKEIIMQFHARVQKKDGVEFVCLDKRGFQNIAEYFYELGKNAK